MGTELQTTPPAAPEKKKGLALADLIASRRDSFAAVAAKNFDPDRLVKLAQAALARNPKLAQCHAPSVLLCLMKCSELGLEPDSALPQRRMWLVPRWNSKLGATECTHQIDYRAQLQIARDTGIVSSIVAAEVRENDEWDYRISPENASMASFTFKPKVFEERGKIIGYFAAARLKDGEVQVVAMSQKDVENHRDRFAQKTKSGDIVGPWSTDFVPMALKTCLRRLWNLLPAGSGPEAQKVQSAVAAEAESEGVIDLQMDVPTDPEEPTPEQADRAQKMRDKVAAATGKKAPEGAPSNGANGHEAAASNEPPHNCIAPECPSTGDAHPKVKGAFVCKLHRLTDAEGDIKIVQEWLKAYRAAHKATAKPAPAAAPEPSQDELDRAQAAEDEARAARGE